jgi:hypothetical protein
MHPNDTIDLPLTVRSRSEWSIVHEVWVGDCYGVRTLTPAPATVVIRSGERAGGRHFLALRGTATLLGEWVGVTGSRGA